MSDLDRAQAHALTCRRFAADCKRSAEQAPALRDHFQHMADVWAEMADERRALH